MTAEQIKQNAEEYASKFAPAKKHKTGIPLAINHTAMISFIEGAHSRDEEVASLLSQLEDKDGYIAHLREELDNLRNPWISVEDRLPDKWKRIKVQQGTGEECYSWISKDVWVMKEGWLSPEKAFYDYEANIWWSEYGDNIENIFGTPTHWMYFSELPKQNKEG